MGLTLFFFHKRDNVEIGDNLPKRVFERQEELLLLQRLSTV